MENATNVLRVVFTLEEYKNKLDDFEGKDDILQGMKDNNIKASANGVGFYLQHINNLDKLTAIRLLSPFMNDDTTDREWNTYMPSDLQTKIED